MSIIGSIPTSRISDTYTRQQLLTQINGDQSTLTKLQQELSTGNAFQLPSDSPAAALRGIAANNLIQQNTQYSTNLSLTQSYLNESESVLSNASNLLSSVNSTVLSAIGSTATPQTVSSALNTVTQALNQLIQLGNTKFNGQYLFSGSETGTAPFQLVGNNVAYLGNDNSVNTYSSQGTLLQTNITGDQAFGAVSAGVQSGINLNPSVTEGTSLADLNGGQGVDPGSIAVSNGTSTSIVDLSSAATVGDVARLLELHPPAGSTITATVTSSGLNVQLNGGGNITITEVGNGTTAAELGILHPENANPTSLIVGSSLNPTLDSTTLLSNILGTKAGAVISSPGPANDIVVQANTNGAQYNGATINLIDDSKLQAAPGLIAGNEKAVYNAAATPATASLKLGGPSNDLILTANTAGTQLNGVSITLQTQAGLGDNALAQYDASTKTLTLTVDSSDQTSTQSLMNAIDADGTFTATRDTSAESNTSGGYVLSSGAGVGISNTYNSGGNANTLDVYIQTGVSTAKQVIAAINNEGTFSAQLDSSEPNNNGSGTVVDGWNNPGAITTTSGGSGQALDQSSGFQIVNGGKTYDINISGAKTVQDLLSAINSSNAGVVASINASRTSINVQSTLSGSNFSIGENGGTTATQLGIRSLTTSTPLADLNSGAGVSFSTSGPDLTINSAGGVSIPVSFTGATTIGDVINAINNAASSAGAPVVAQLASVGNGIELVDNEPGSTGTLSVAGSSSGNAATALGLISSTTGASAASTAAVAATDQISFPGPNNDIVISGTPAGSQLNGVTVQFHNDGAGPSVNFDASTNVLTFDVDPSTTTANDLIALAASDPTVSQNFALSLASSDSGNDGSGTLGSLPAASQLSGGQGTTLTSADTNPIQVQGVFSALVSLRNALQNDDTTQIQSAMQVLNQAMTTVSSAQGALGVRLQAIDNLTSNLQTQQLNLQSAASDDLDANITEVISNLLGAQTSLQASLEATGLISQLTLLNYISLSG